MELYWKAIGGILIALILGLALGKDMSILLSLAVCAMGTAVAVSYLEPVINLLKQLQNLSAIKSDTMEVLFKILGIALLSEITGMICADAGNSAAQKMLKILSFAGILWVSIPVFEAVILLLQQILGGI